MHLARAVVLRSPVSGQLRFASGAHHTQGEHAEPGFSTLFWRNTLLVSLLAVSFYKWAPPRDDDAYLTRWIARYSTPPDSWARLNEKHMSQSQHVADNALVQAGATRPAIIRYRYPQSLDQASPHLQAVGSMPDMSGVVARSD